MHALIQNVLSGGSISDKVFYVFFSFFHLVDKGRENQNTTKSGPSLDHQRDAISMALCWWADNVCSGD